MRKSVAAIAAVAVGLLSVAASDEGQSTEQAKQAIGAAAGQALQGQAPEAVALLSAIPAEQFGPKERAIRDCIIERFGPRSLAPQLKSDSTITERAIAAYRNYWWAALTQPGARASAEEKLNGDLRKLLHLPRSADRDAIEESLRTGMEREGFHPLLGTTPPLLELIVWKSETDEIRDVHLPEGNHRISVKLLDQFESLGWSAYATCDRSFTGGWVKPDAIYAVRPGWKDLADENFAVSFIAHETQHFADKERFGELESWELEYRAKLAELALADVTLPKLLAGFDSNQGSDPRIPHSHANKLVLERLREKLGLATSSDIAAAAANDINAVAQALLIEDTAKRAGQVGERRPDAP